MGNVTPYAEFKNGQISKMTRSRYDQAGQVVWSRVDENTGTPKASMQETTNQYDAAGHLLASSLHMIDDKVNKSYQYLHDIDATGQENRIRAYGDANGSSSLVYNANHQLVTVNQGKGDGKDRAEITNYLYNADNQILSKIHDDGKHGVERMEYHYTNGNIEAQTGIDAEGKNQSKIDTGNYALFQMLDDSHPGIVSRYTIRTGDTLQSIASAVYGTSSLWYLIADANGLMADSHLIDGNVITIPNTAQTGKIDSNRFKVYNQSEIEGSKMPNLILPGDRCGALSQLIGVVVTAVVTFFTGGNAVVGAMAGNAATQYSAAAFNGRLDWGDLFKRTLTDGVVSLFDPTGLAVVYRNRDLSHPPGFTDSEYNWKSTVIAGAAAYVGGQLANGASPLSGSTFGAVVGRAAVTNVVSQGLSIAAHQQNGFDWKGLAKAGVSSSVSYGVSNLVGQSQYGSERWDAMQSGKTSADLMALSDSQRDWSNTFVRNAAGDIAGNVAGDVVTTGRPHWQSDIVGGLGSAAVAATTDKYVEADKTRNNALERAWQEQNAPAQFGPKSDIFTNWRAAEKAKEDARISFEAQDETRRLNQLGPLGSGGMSIDELAALVTNDKEITVLPDGRILFPDGHIRTNRSTGSTIASNESNNATVYGQNLNLIPLDDPSPNTSLLWKGRDKSTQPSAIEKLDNGNTRYHYLDYAVDVNANGGYSEKETPLSTRVKLRDGMYEVMEERLKIVSAAANPIAEERTPLNDFLFRREDGLRKGDYATVKAVFDSYEDGYQLHGDMRHRAEIMAYGRALNPDNQWGKVPDMKTQLLVLGSISGLTAAVAAAPAAWSAISYGARYSKTFVVNAVTQRSIGFALFAQPAVAKIGLVVADVASQVLTDSNAPSPVGELVLEAKEAKSAVQEVNALNQARKLNPLVLEKALPAIEQDAKNTNYAINESRLASGNVQAEMNVLSDAAKTDIKGLGTANSFAKVEQEAARDSGSFTRTLNQEGNLGASSLKNDAAIFNAEAKTGSVVIRNEASAANNALEIRQVEKNLATNQANFANGVDRLESSAAAQVARNESAFARVEIGNVSKPDQIQITRNKLNEDAAIAFKSANLDEQLEIAKLHSGNAPKDIEGLLEQMTIKARKEANAAKLNFDGYVPDVYNKLKTSLANYETVVNRGYPFGFESLEKFNAYKQTLNEAVSKFSVPINDIRVQGSSVHKVNPGDIDIMIAVDSETFDLLASGFIDISSNNNVTKELIKEASKGKIPGHRFITDGTEKLRSPAQAVYDLVPLKSQVTLIKKGSPL
ncbi:LysM peptidoglycan-binding domain-containing protein [Undibacterium sp. Di26W]|uniref:LysM peptidoglycan-binding domain-containing protein n=1 Tax=Undibacterium sp. Di26W TaxID=3413035 RepID=UPI003BF1EB90